MKRTPGRTLADKVAYWTRHIVAARRYNEGVPAYCRDRKIEKTTIISGSESLEQCILSGAI